MKRSAILCVCLALASVASAQTSQQKQNAGQAETSVQVVAPVIIQGVKWSPVNVGEKGAFVKNSWDPGGYFNQVEARTACPDGWRLPSGKELYSLTSVKNEWVIMKGVLGRKFMMGEISIFLPAAGYKSTSNEVVKTTEQGWYWAYSTVSGVKYFLDFYETVVNKGGTAVLANEGISIRCVLDE